MKDKYETPEEGGICYCWWYHAEPMMRHEQAGLGWNGVLPLVLPLVPLTFLLETGSRD